MLHVDGNVVGRPAEDKAEQPLLHQLALEEHLVGVDFGEDSQGEADRVGRTDQGIEEGDPFVGQVVIEVGVHVLEGEDEERHIGESMEMEMTLFVGASEVVGCLLAWEEEKAILCYRRSVIKTHVEFLDGFL